jgi:glycosyltransferase involved in cell wall biosynthesis
MPTRRRPRWSALSRMAAILFCVLDYHPDPAGGAERQARLQAEELARRGHRVTVVCRGSGASRAGYIGAVRVDRLRSVGGRPWRWLHYPRLAWYLARHAGEHDLIHVHHANLQADLAVAAGRLHRRPVFLKVAGSGPGGEIARLRWLRGWTGHVALRHARVVQAQTRQIADELRAIGVRPARIVEIPNGLDPTALHPIPAPARDAARRALGLADGTTVALSLGRFAVEKGTADLLVAWAPLRDRADLALLLVGRAAGLRPVTPAGGGNVIVRPWLADPTVALQAADLFVLPSHGEGMSNALLEALASGLPAVVTPVGAGSALVEATGAGVLVPVGDAAAIRVAIVDLAADPARRRAAGTAGRAAVADLTIERVVDRIEAIYRRILPADHA